LYSTNTFTLEVAPCSGFRDLCSHVGMRSSLTLYAPIGSLVLPLTAANGSIQGLWTDPIRPSSRVLIPIAPLRSLPCLPRAVSDRPRWQVLSRVEFSPPFTSGTSQRVRSGAAAWAMAVPQLMPSTMPLVRASVRRRLSFCEQWLCACLACRGHLHARSQQHFFRHFAGTFSTSHQQNHSLCRFGSPGPWVECCFYCGHHELFLGR
jgi:hypothetical protein